MVGNSYILLPGFVLSTSVSSLVKKHLINATDCYSFSLGDDRLESPNPSSEKKTNQGLAKLCSRDLLIPNELVQKQISEMDISATPMTERKNYR